jgi:cell division septal protein FtsQ
VSEPKPPEQRVRIRRAPKFSVFLVLGALVGILVSLILTASFPIDPTVGFGPTFGYFAIYGFVAGLLLGSIVALIFDRVLSRKARTVPVTVDRLQVPDQESRAEIDAPGDP